MSDKSAGDDATLASRYLADQLSEEERAAFEARLIEDPAVLAELEATARLKVGLENLRSSGELERLLKPRWSARPGWFALAASIGLLMVGVVLWRTVLTTTEPSLLAASASFVTSTGQPLQIGGTYALLRTRANTYDATIELGEAPQAIELRVLPENAGQMQQTYRVALSRVGDDGSTQAPLAEIGGLKAAEDGFVTVYADSTGLTAGRYQVAISAEGSETAEPETFLIRVVTP